MSYEDPPLRVGDVVSDAHKDFYYLLGAGVLDIDGRVIFGEQPLGQDDGAGEAAGLALYRIGPQQEN